MEQLFPKFYFVEIVNVVAEDNHSRELLVQHHDREVRTAEGIFYIYQYAGCIEYYPTLFSKIF